MRNQKSYELKRNFLQSLVNSQQDISDVADEHGLQGILQYGSHLQKIVELLDAHMQNSWFKTIAEEDVRKEQRWERMIRFLKAELKVVQIRAVESSSSSASCEKKDNRDNSGSRSSGGAHITGGDEQIPAAAAAAGALVATDGKCDLCGEKHYNPGINFVLCKRFLQMGIKKRKDLVMRKKRCLQCLDGQTGWRETDHKWKCTNRWVCRNDFHDSFDKKLHFLLCEQHADDPQNKQLYEEFKKDVLVTEWQKKLASSIYVC